ncbi:MAG: esterase-like activity of phytase family protein [Caulobacter sp.]|nr:esterase-like activity of phytase family protein [Caulobacter sp.]
MIGAARRLLTWAAPMLLAGCVSASVELPPAPVAWGPSIAVETAPVPLDPSDPAATAVGDFRYAGGIAITSTATSRLHGLSDLVLTSDSRIASVSDDGADLFTATMRFDATGRLAGLAGVALRPLTEADGGPFTNKSRSDAEGLSFLSNGDMLVSFERDHRIWRYPASGDPRPVPVPMPPVPMASNDGMEGLAAAADNSGYWVGVEPGSIWFCRLELSCDPVEGLPVPPVGYRLSGLTTGPDGELVILHHSFIPAIGSRIILTVVRSPREGKTVIGRLAMGPSTTVDNFEGVAVAPQANGDWRLFLLSDDNFNPSQRTLLLALDWTPPQ